MIKIKYSFILLFSLLLIKKSYSQDFDGILKNRISVSFVNKTFTESVKIITDQAGIGFSFSDEVMNYPGKFALDMNDESLQVVLLNLLKGTNITYKIIGNQVVFKEIKPSKYNKITISGYVREEISKELLTGVNVYIPDLKIGTVSNTYGFYSISIPQMDTVSLIVSFVGYSKEKLKLKTNNNVDININLKPNATLNEVVIVADQVSKQSENVQMSTINVPVQQIKNVPSLLGEKDVLKVIQLMPGVQKGGEGTSGFYVRGGSPDQNLIILDDAIVYNVSHLFGFFSLFNGDALKSVELTKGGFPARYGGRLSSVLELNMKEGNKQEWHGEAGIGLISSRFMLEGPLKKDKASILISGRRTYADLLAMSFMGSRKFGYFFYDFNAKINYDFGRKNKLYLSGYFGRDKCHYKDSEGSSRNKNNFFWGNATATIRWNHLFNDKIFSNTSLIYSKYKFLVSATEQNIIDNNINTYAEYYSGIQDVTLKYDMDYLPAPKHWIKAGFLITDHFYEPHAFVSIDNIINTFERDYKSNIGLENAIYIEDTYMPICCLKINAGLRLSAFITNRKNYWNLEPRISTAWRIIDNIAFKASYAEMNQYIHLLSNTGVGLPTDLWVPATDKVKPQTSKQLAAGVIWDILNKGLTFSLEGYYKKMNNIITYKEGSSFIDMTANELTTTQDAWENKVTSGKGKSYGLEFLLHRKIGKLSGWVGYTLSWTKLQFDSVNFGKEYYARYDRRHDISVVGIYKLSSKITLSASWIYGTGNAITLPTSGYFANTHTISQSYTFDYNNDTKWVQTFSQKNDFRMEPYHRLDVGIQFHKKKKWGERTWELSVYNVYNRHNPYFYTTAGIGYNSEKSIYNNQLKKVTLFPIIPSITYSIKF
jgi:hypothetical protein